MKMFNYKATIESDITVPANKVTNILKGVAADIEAYAKLKAPVDVGLMRAGIHYSMISPVEFVIGSNVSYDIYFEEGTRRHFVPFFEWRGKGQPHGELTTLGHWAMRVMGLSEADLAKMGGMQIQTKKLEMYKGGIKEAIANLERGT